jgi:hypothetical protein
MPRSPKWFSSDLPTVILYVFLVSFMCTTSHPP